MPAHSLFYWLLLLLYCLSITGAIFAPEILWLMKAEERVVQEGAVFTRIMLGGSTVIVLLFLINGIFRGGRWCGHCHAKFVGWPVSSIFFYAPCWSMDTDRSEPGIERCGDCYHYWKRSRSSINAIIFFVRENIRIKWPHFKWDFPVIKHVYEVAWPATLQFFIQSGSWIVLAWLVSGYRQYQCQCRLPGRSVTWFSLSCPHGDWVMPQLRW